MLVFIIDAFNLIYKVPRLRNSNTPHKELLHFIKNNNLTGSSRNRVEIIFDGAISHDLVNMYHNFKVTFSNQITADEVIKSKLEDAKNPRQVVVVSDDRQIQSYARRAGAKISKISEFIRLKDKTNAKKGSEVNTKDISFSLQHEITEEMRKIWDKE